MQWEEISLDQIESEIKGEIEECSKKIKRFVEVVNYQLEYAGRLQGFVFKILRKKSYAFEDDGNTKTDGYKYKVIWAYSFGKYNPSLAYIQNGIQEDCLYFEYENSERIRDHQPTENRFLSLYLCGPNYPSCNEVVERIDYNNSNYELTSIINAQNAATCTLKIKDIQKRRALERFFENIKI